MEGGDVREKKRICYLEDSFVLQVGLSGEIQHTDGMRDKGKETKTSFSSFCALFVCPEQKFPINLIIESEKKQN